jgi:hypothetical protein
MTCAHQGCLCLVDGGERFCSDHCREHADDGGHAEHRCECGHPACESLGG